MNLGELIKKYRLENNITMEEFAINANLTKGYISMLEKNQNPKTKREIVPSFSTIQQIASVMSLTTAEIISILDEDQPISWDKSPADSDFMEIGKRIKQQREESGLSQDELANMLGYKSRSSINKLEQGKTDIPLHKLEQLAEALECSPAYLMGWEENTDQETETITKTENELLNKYRKLNDIGEEKISEYIDDLLCNSKYVREFKFTVSDEISADAARKIAELILNNDTTEAK